MSQKVVRLMVGTEDQSVRCLVTLLFDDATATEDDVGRVVANAAAHTLTRYIEGPHEEGSQR
jgi:hypothetical protein